jgi:acetolactate synthase-1/2/3 large subunit
MIMITGQKGIRSRKQARFQVVDMVSTMTPLTKMAHQIVSPVTIPSIVREAFRVAQQERPGAGPSRAAGLRRDRTRNCAHPVAPDRPAHCAARSIGSCRRAIGAVCHKDLHPVSQFELPN